MQRGRAPEAGERGRRNERRKLTVRISEYYVRIMQLVKRREPGITNDQIVCAGLALLVEAPAVDEELLFRRLDRLQRLQQDVNERTTMLGRHLAEALHLWFERWPELPAVDVYLARGRGMEMVRKYLSSLSRLLHSEAGEGFDFLDPDSLMEYLKVNTADVQEDAKRTGYPRAEKRR